MRQFDFPNDKPEHDTEENGRVCDTLEMKKNLFCKEESGTELKGIINNKAPGVDSVINEFPKYGDCAVRDKLMKIMNMIFLKNGKHLIQLKDELQ